MKSYKRTKEHAMKIAEARRKNGTYVVSDEQKRKLSLALSGSKNHQWKGGKIKDKHGYILVKCPGHPMCNSLGYVREHRLKMEEKIGRLLTRKEVVHHINHQKDDNRIENLELYESGGKHLIAEHIVRDAKGKFKKND